jgi:hypothetical protein
MAFRVLKQLIPNDIFSEDPSWAQREVWVAKLNPDDTLDEFEDEVDAEAKKLELETADPTNRIYKIVEV